MPVASCWGFAFGVSCWPFAVFYYFCGGDREVFCWSRAASPRFSGGAVLLGARGSLVSIYVTTGPSLGRKKYGFGALIFEGASSVGPGGVFCRSKNPEMFLGLFVLTILITVTQVQSFSGSVKFVPSKMRLQIYPHTGGKEAVALSSRG